MWNYTGMSRLVRSRMKQGMGIDAEKVQSSEAFLTSKQRDSIEFKWNSIKLNFLTQGLAALDSVRSEFEFASQLLSDGRPFLCGSSLTAADITFVCLALPALNVPYAATAPLCDPNVFTPPLALAAAALELRGGICLCCLLLAELSQLLSRQNLRGVDDCPRCWPDRDWIAGTAAGAWAAALYVRERGVVLQE